MFENRSYAKENADERERLKALIAKLSDEELSRPLGDGWTAATLFAHLAFWDQRQRRLIEKWKRTGVGQSPVDVDIINEAVRELCSAIQPRAAARLALDAAEALDRELELLEPEFIKEIEALENERIFRRSLHRREHLDPIEQAFT
jgi:hypothetical protein